MTVSFDHMLVSQYKGKSVTEILNATPAALAGVSEADAQHLDDAFGIKTVSDLAGNSFFTRARAILAADGTQGFDPGPSRHWETFFASAPIDQYLAHCTGDNHPPFRIEFGPVYYRGRLDGSARVIVVGQDPSTNEILAQRVFVGNAGQRIQGLFKKLGITRSYVLLNVSLFSVYGQLYDSLKAILLEPEILAFRNQFLDRLVQENPIQAVIAVGAGGRHAVDNWPGAGTVPVFEIVHPSNPDAAATTASWNANLPGLQATVAPDDDGEVDVAPYGAAFTSGDEVPIPRFDLPFGIPEWHGNGGGRSYRPKDNDSKTIPDNIVWDSPLTPTV